MKKLSRLMGLSSLKVLTIGLCLVLAACSRPPVEERLADESLFRGVSLVGMSVSDLDASVHFYQDHLALTEPSISQDDARELLAGLHQSPVDKLHTKVLRSSNFQMLLMDFNHLPNDQDLRQPAVPVNGPGMAHMCYQVNKALETYQHMLEDGAAYIGAPEMQSMSFISPVLYAYAHDRDGLIMELEHVNMTFIPDSVSGGQDRRVRHVSFGTPDIDRLMAFYQAFLNVDKPRRSNLLQAEAMDNVSGLPGSQLYMGWMHVGNLELEFIEYTSHPVDAPEAPRPLEALGYNLLLIDVSDVAKAQKRFVDAGGEILPQRTQIQGQPVVWGRDVDGNLIGLFSAESSSALSARDFDFIPSV